jgi:heme-degrading monooxygenase HmoA
MIARTWDGVTEARRGDEYSEYVRRTGVAELAATEGNRGVYVLRRVEGDRARFRVVSLWDSMEGIRRFAGDDPERARYYPEDEKFLLSLTPTVEHYEVAVASGRPSVEVAALADEIHRIGAGDAWHGPSLLELLGDVSAQQAAAHPLSAGHSIWELVLHIAAWIDVGRRRLEGKAVEEPEEGDYPPVGAPTEERWAAAQVALRSGHERLRETVARLSADDLDSPTPGRPYNLRFQIGSSVRHVVYHSGQIGLLKRATSASG